MDIVEEPTNRDKIFKGQQKNEEMICFFRHHWIDLLKEFIFFIIFTSIVIILIDNIESIKNILRGNRAMKLLFFTGFLAMTVYLHRFFLKLYNHFINLGIITNMRLIDHQKSLFFTDNMDSIDMAQIQNIEKIQEGIWPSILGFGDIKVFLNASDTVKTFKHLPNAKFHFRCLTRAKELRQEELLRERSNNAIHQKIKTDLTGKNIPDFLNRDINVTF